MTLIWKNLLHANFRCGRPAGGSLSPGCGAARGGPPIRSSENRIRWAGLVPEDFEIYTTYEASTFCKPNPAYYLEVARTLGVKPEECLMVGNDATEDMAAREVGMDVFLLTDCLINAKNRDLNAYPRGDFAALNAYIDALQ